MRAQPFLRLVLGLTCVTSLAACTTAQSGAGSRYVVTAPRSQFYKYGPAQAFGADLVLPHGQKITMLETSFGFSKVMTDEGIAGYVASDEIEPAPPEPAAAKATPSPKPSRGMAGGKPRRSNVQSTPGSPLFDVGDVPPPPLPTNPEPQPSPGFRF